MIKNTSILSLDAGGTNLVFTHIKNSQIQKKHSIPTASDTLEDFLEKLIQGFRVVMEDSAHKAEAISFCFPGPADYGQGIIGDLENLPFFKGGVPLKRMLENQFKNPCIH